MLKSGLRLGALVTVLSLVSASAFAQKVETNSDKAVGALATFAVGYAGWVWEDRCHSLPPARHEAFKTLVSEQLLRLNAIFEPDLVGAATGSGRATATNPKYASCTGEYADFADFGYQMMQDAAAELKPLPADLRIRMTR